MELAIEFGNPDPDYNPDSGSGLLSGSLGGGLHFSAVLGSRFIIVHVFLENV